MRRGQASLDATWRAAPGSCGGQASVELIGMLPVLVVVVLAVGQVLAAGAARELAGTAAQAGAMALLQGRDPEASAARAVPAWGRRDVRIDVDGRRITVRLRPRGVLPGMAALLTATSTADAGPRR